jgi:hypothetical protein
MLPNEFIVIYTALMGKATRIDCTRMRVNTMFIMGLQFIHI